MPAVTAMTDQDPTALARAVLESPHAVREVCRLAAWLEPDAFNALVDAVQAASQNRGDLLASVRNGTFGATYVAPYVSRGDIPARTLPHVGSGSQPDPERRAVRQVTEVAPAQPLSGLKVAPLTRQERTVLRLLAQGYSQRHVAQVLFVSCRTIHFHMQNIRRKTNTRNALSAVAVALHQGLIEPVSDIVPREAEAADGEEY